MQTAFPVLIEKSGTGYEVAWHAFWGVSIPYLPEVRTSTHLSASAEDQWETQKWIRCLRGLSQLPANTCTFDLRFRCEPGQGSSKAATIHLAILGHVTSHDGAQVARQQASAAYQLLNDQLPFEYQLRFLELDKLKEWLDPYPTPQLVEIRKKVIPFRGDAAQPLPYRMRGHPLGIQQTLRTMLYQEHPCLVSIAITPTRLSPSEQGLLQRAAYAAQFGSVGPRERAAKYWADLMQGEIRDVLNGVFDSSVDGHPPFLPQLQRIGVEDGQSALALWYYYQLLNTPELFTVRLSVLSAMSYLPSNLARTLSADVAQPSTTSRIADLVGCELVEQDQADQLELLRHAATAGGNRLSTLCLPVELTGVFQLPAGSGTWFGVPIRPVSPFRSYGVYSQPVDSYQAVNLGTLINTSRHSQSMTYKIPLKDFTEHVGLFGNAGSGKTATGIHVVQEIRRVTANMGQPTRLLLIDPKGDLRPLMRYPIAGRGMLVFSAGSEVAPLVLDPFRVPDGVSPDQHIHMLMACLSAAFPDVSASLDMYLTVVVRELYTDLYGPDLLRPLQQGEQRPVTPPNILQYLSYKAAEFFERSTFRGDWKQDAPEAIKYRLKWLAEGPMGQIIVPRPGARVLDIDTLLENDVLIDFLPLVAETDKALLMALLLGMLGEHFKFSVRARGHMSDSAGTLRNLMWVDEAQILFHRSVPVNSEQGGSNAQTHSLELFVDSLATMRSRGLGLIYSTQLPLSLDPLVVKHPGTRLLMRLGPKDDRKTIGNMMNLTSEQLDFITELPTGEVIAFRGSLPQAVHVVVPDTRGEWAKERAQRQGRQEPLPVDRQAVFNVPDEEIRTHMVGQSFGQIQPVSVHEAIFEDRMIYGEDALPSSCSFCVEGRTGSSCCGKSELKRMWATRNGDVDIADIWNALLDDQWQDMMDRTGEYLQTVPTPELTYCAVAHLAQMKYEGKEIGDSDHRIRPALQRFAECYGLDMTPEN